MDEEFVDQVRRALELTRRRQYRELGRLPRLRDLRLIENSMHSSPERSEVYFGEAIENLLWEAIEGLKPDFPEDLNAPVWRIYIALRDHSKRGEEWETVAERLGVGESTFQEIKRVAGEELAAKIWEMEEQTRLAVKPKDNLPPQPFAQYIERRNYNYLGRKPIIWGFGATDDLAAIIVERLRGKPWIISLNGAPGAGKSALAYQVGKLCKERFLFEAIIWASAKRKCLRVEATSFALVPYVAKPIVSCDDILETIAQVLENRAVNAPNGYDTKVKVVSDLLKRRRCLIIIDNLEDFTPTARDQLSILLTHYTGFSKVLLTSRVLIDVGDLRVDIPGLTPEEAFKFTDLACTMKGLNLLKKEEAEALYKATDGNPLAMNLVLGLVWATKCSLTTAVDQFKRAGDVLEYLWGATYNQLDEEGKRVLHGMPIFSPYSASADAIRATSWLDLSRVQTSLGIACNLGLVTEAHSRYKLGSFVPDFLQRQGEVAIDSMPLSEFTAKAYVGLAEYYIHVLQERTSIDQRLKFLQDDEKEIVLKALQGCRALADANLKYEGCSAHEARRYVINLFDLIGHPLGLVWRPNDRLYWGKEACDACGLLGEERKELWFRVFDIGWTHLILGNTKEAKEIFTTSLKRATEKGYEDVQALILHNEGRMVRDEGRLEEASELFVKSLDLWLRCKSEEWIAHTKSSLGLVRYRQAQVLEGTARETKLLEARAILEESLALRRTIGHREKVVEGLSDVALVYAALGMLPEAWKSSDQALQLGRPIPAPATGYAYALRSRAELWAYLGKIEEAKACVQEACDIYKAAGAEYMYQMAKKYEQYLGEISKNGGRG